jgi:SPOR domain
VRQRFIPCLAVCLVAALPALAREPLQPAEQPPPDFLGQQYVDSRGCAFVRAGSGGEVLWVPRVSREGKPLCSSPPSGRRVQTTGVEASTATEVPKPAAEPASTGASTGGLFVAVGSFGIAENADKAEAKLRGMDYGVVRGRLQGGSGTLVTVFAGPFADAAAAASARQILRDAGFPDATVIGP